MLSILFPHMYEDIEYLLPSEDSDSVIADISSVMNVGESSQGAWTPNGRGHNINAVAGPSRLS